MKTKLPSHSRRFAGTIFSRIHLVLLCLLFISYSSVAQVHLVKDINTTPTEPLDFLVYDHLTDVNGTLFFVLEYRQLWKSESSGTSASLVKEFSSINRLTSSNGMLFFVANDGIHGQEVWKSDGTPAGTVMVKDIRFGAEGSGPTELTDVNGVLFFSAHDGSTGREVWKTDGTAEGTVKVKDIMRVVGSSNPADLTSMNGLLYFTANDGQHGYELWKSDGTEAGTTIVVDIRSAYKVSSRPQQLTNVNGTLFFTALETPGLRRLYKSDGTVEGTAMLSDEIENPDLLTNVDGTLFFSGDEPEHGRELWKSDGTSGGTVLVKDITPGSGSTHTPNGLPHLMYFTSANGKLYFLAMTQMPGSATASQNLWVSDGTEAGTLKLTDDPGTAHYPSPYITPFKGLVYYISKTAAGYESIFRTDGTPNGEEVFVDNVADRYFGYEELTVVGNFLYYVSHARLWRTDGTDHELIQGSFNTTFGSNPTEITDANGITYFSAHDGMHYGLWKSDGTTEGTTLIQYFDDHIYYLTVSGNNLYYMADPIDNDTIDMWFKLWRTDLTTGATTWVSDINEGGGDYLVDLEDVNGTLYFTIEVPINPGEEFPRTSELWKTTGTLASTRHIKTFNELGRPPYDLINVNGTLFFSAITDPEVGEELWKSDGTSAGTVMVKKINPDPLAPSAPQFFTNVNGTLYFVAYADDYELYKTDGTATGTVRVKDIRTDDNNESDIGALANVNGTLYFAATDEPDETGQFPRHIWKTDGTEAGTIKVTTFPPYNNWGYPTIQGIYILGEFNGNLVIGVEQRAGLSSAVMELWSFNETTGAIERIVGPNMISTNFLDRVGKDDLLYFTSNIPAYNNRQVWRTDGTACGSFAVVTSGNPGDLALSNNEIYMAYTSDQYGRELFVLDASAIAAPCEEMTITSAMTEAITVLDDETQEARVVSYPNPFTADFVLNVSGDEGALFNLSIRDMKGIATGEYAQLPCNQDHQLGATLKPGVYLLHIQKRDGMVVKKVVKTH